MRGGVAWIELDRLREVGQRVVVLMHAIVNDAERGEAEGVLRRVTQCFF